MPTIDPTQYLLDALSTLTGGLVDDIKTLILGMVVCAFIMMGIDYLVSIINRSFAWSAHKKYMSAAQELREEMKQYRKDSAEYDEAKTLYWSFIRKGAESRRKDYKL